MLHGQLVDAYLESGQEPYSAIPRRFVPDLSSSAAKELAFNNFANVTVSSPGTYRKVIEEIAKSAEKPFQTGSLSPLLEKKALIRGVVCFNHVWKLVDDLALNWREMRWWLTENGLSMEPLNSRQLASRIKIKALTRFEAIAGKLFFEKMVNRQVSDGDLLAIARILDREQFSLKEELRPGDWKPISFHNQKFSRRPIRTFEEAIKSYSRAVRRSLSAAKGKYEKAIKT